MLLKHVADDSIMDDEALLLDPTTTNSSDHNNSRNVTADEDVIVGIVGIGSPIVVIGWKTVRGFTTLK